MLLAGFVATAAAAPLESATVTRVENKATVAEIRGGQAIDAHPARLSEVISTSSFLQTSIDSRAELEFLDKSLLRVGPNTIFSFDARSRTLSLEKGDMLFYLPPGRGGVKLKTAALTAALTGTVVFLSPRGIVALDGTVTLTYQEDGVEKKAVIKAGTEKNAAKWVNGKLVIYHSTGKDALWFPARRKLLQWAKLPSDAEKKIAFYNPWLRQAAADYASAALLEYSNESFFIGILPYFGGGSGTSGGGGGANGGTGQTVTAVLPNGLVLIFDSAGTFLGLR